ncbi:PEP-CTERM sorting domain-containing protein [Paraglaciecola arctica]|uniref:PEP-CTERM protein-sorting domain-containing protein n=1 Tax=Paraglaciecola arctica BSs20135 TaxID=493475 RepID=K6YME2_9ALTE|nr:PEP-CTERM sorting domain-containing protein [Paraglaciecola arctica]GAC19327.1 hypothetical protein GARC_2361 [Paraglaciecola arctica BSs20135]|tara:strand:+ start:63 stop:629 length:567 start_codon:yes stop_codon:yes gene_type:complete
MKNFLLALSLVLSVNVQAAVIKFNLDASDYQVGDTISGQLVVSDFSGLLGAFWADMEYSTSGVSVLGWSFGVGFDDGLGSLSIGNNDSVSGILSLEEYSDPFADTAILTAAQGTAFVLANFTLEALSAGDYDLSLGLFGLLDFDNADVDTTAENARFSITQVPEPATIVIFALASMMLLRIKRKQRKN